MIHFLSKYINPIWVFNKITILLKYKIRLNQLKISAKKSTLQINASPTSRNKLIVSLTTYNKRIKNVHLVIESIFQQTYKPNRLILWLDELEFTMDNIPLILHEQVKRGLEIKFCPNYGSYKKLVPSLLLELDSDIITIDDDVLYPKEMIDMLMKEHVQFPDCVIAHKVHKMKCDNRGYLLPYSKWDLHCEDPLPSKFIFPVGIGGVLYPRSILHKGFADIELFSELAPNADDVWFKAMSLQNSFDSKRINNSRKFHEIFYLIEGSQESALFKSNLNENANDNQIAAVFNNLDLYKMFKK
jgi:hypothetical protein